MPERKLLHELGARIIVERGERGIDQAELARRIEKSASYVSRIEAGSVVPSLEVVEDIADALDCDREELMRLALAAHILRISGKRIGEAQLKRALRWLIAEDSPIDRTLSWVVDPVDLGS